MLTWPIFLLLSQNRRSTAVCPVHCVNDPSVQKEITFSVYVTTQYLKANVRSARKCTPDWQVYTSHVGMFKNVHSITEKREMLLCRNKKSDDSPTSETRAILLEVKPYARNCTTCY